MHVFVVHWSDIRKDIINFIEITELIQYTFTLIFPYDPLRGCGGSNWPREWCWLVFSNIKLTFSFSQKEATFPLVRRDYYRKTIQGGLYINQGITLRPSSRI